MASVLIYNYSRFGASNFYVGDRWIVVIEGATPSSLVTNTAQRNDFGWSTTSYGYTDNTGRFYLIGSMGPGDIGIWEEIWKVGGVQVGSSLFLTVLPSPYPLPTEDPIPIVEERWAYGLDDEAHMTPPLDFDVLDGATTIYGKTIDFFVGMTRVEQIGLAWNISTSTGWPQFAPARHRVRSF